MDNKLTGKSVIITGGTSGIGKAAAEAFLAEDCKVTVCDFRADLIDEVNAQNNPNLYGVVADMTAIQQVRALLAATEKRYGGIDIMVNNAGVGNPYGYLTMDDQQWHKVMDINLKAVIASCNEVIPYLKKRGGGVILNTSSLGGRITSTVRSIYGLTKASITAYTKVLAAELASENIRVCGVAPGMIKTDMVVVNNRHLQDINVLGRSSVMQRLGETSEIASGMVFLASDWAKHVNGEIIEITGGKCIVQDPDYSWK